MPWASPGKLNWEPEYLGGVCHATKRVHAIYTPCCGPPAEKSQIQTVVVGLLTVLNSDALLSAFFSPFPLC